jgi:hypothetical protein
LKYSTTEKRHALVSFPVELGAEGTKYDSDFHIDAWKSNILKEVAIWTAPCTPGLSRRPSFTFLTPSTATRPFYDKLRETYHIPSNSSNLTLPAATLDPLWM